MYGSTTLIYNSSIDSNIAQRYGGGIYSESPYKIENSSINFNEAQRGGGVYSFAGDNTTEFINTNISHNRATYGGGGAYFYRTALVRPVKLRGTNISFNTAPEGGNSHENKFHLLHD